MVRTLDPVVEMGVQPRLVKLCGLLVLSSKMLSLSALPMPRRLTVSEAATTVSPGAREKPSVQAV